MPERMKVIAEAIGNETLQRKTSMRVEQIMIRVHIIV